MALEEVGMTMKEMRITSHDIQKVYYKMHHGRVAAAINQSGSQVNTVFYNFMVAALDKYVDIYDDLQDALQYRQENDAMATKMYAPELADIIEEIYQRQTSDQPDDV